MKTEIDYLVKFEAGNFYHVYNRTNNREKLFLEDIHRERFLSKYWQYLSGCVETYAYCLLGNHFHFLIKIRTVEEILGDIVVIPQRDRTSAENCFLKEPTNELALHTLVSGQFNRLFTAYAMYFNKITRRRGNLFYRPFKRLVIRNEAHFGSAIFYIHANPVKHRLMKDFRIYSWSSYQELLSDGQTQLARETILEWFGGKSVFLEFHNQDIDFGQFNHWEIED